MKKNKTPNLFFLIALTCLLLGVQLSYSQQPTQNYTPDTLKNKTYKELYNGFNFSYNDTLKEKIYATTYLQKLKKKETPLILLKHILYLLLKLNLQRQLNIAIAL